MSTTDDTEYLITEPEAAARLGLLPQTLRTWRYKRLGLLPYVQVNHEIRYKPSDIDAYIEKQRQPAAEEE